MRGPAIIGAGARLTDAYVGPYTAIGEGCVDRVGAEVEHSILLAGSSVRDLDGRDGVLAARPQRARSAATTRQPRAYRFMVGDNSEVSDPLMRAAGHRAPAGCSAATCVARRRARAATSCVGADRTRARHHRRRRGRRRRERRAAPDASSTAPRGPTSTAPRRTRRGARGQRARRRQPRARRGRPPGRALLHVSTDYVFDGDRATRSRYVESDPTGPRSVYGAHQARRRARGARRLARARGRAHGVAVRRRTARTSSRRCWRSRRERDEVQVVTDQVGCPTWTGHLAPSAARLREREVAAASSTRPPRASARGTSFAQAIFAPGRARRARDAERRSARAGAPGAAPGLERARLRARRRRRCRRGRTASPAISRCAPAADDARMKLLVCGGAGFIGSNFVRLRLREHGDEIVVLDKLTYAGRRENLHDVEDDPRFAFVHGAIEDRRGGRRRDRRACRRDRQLRRRDARRPLDRRARRVRAHPRARHLRAARGRARARRALPAGLDRRGLRLDRGGLVHRGVSPLRPPRPTARPRPAPTCSCGSYHRPSAWRR